jgi:hypothetical protein
MTTNSTSISTVELLRALQNCIYRLGVNKVAGYLNWMATLDTSRPQIVLQIIVESVCAKYKLDPQELLQSQRHDGKNNKALCIIVLLLKKHTMMSQVEIAQAVNRHKSLISRYLSKMKTLNIDLFREDREMYNFYKDIDNSIDFLFEIKIDQWSKNEGADPERPLM